MQRQPIFNIGKLYHTGGTTMDAVKFSVRQHSRKLKRTSELLAKTFGIRRFVAKEEHIWPACVGMFAFPIVLLFVVMIIERKYYKNVASDTFKRINEKKCQ